MKGVELIVQRTVSRSEQRTRLDRSMNMSCFVSRSSTSHRRLLEELCLPFPLCDAAAWSRVSVCPTMIVANPRRVSPFPPWVTSRPSDHKTDFDFGSSQAEKLVLSLL